jgi:adenosylcobinamide-GDP ribazoletransferase
MPALPSFALLRALAEDGLGCWRFYTRLAIPPFAFERQPHAVPDFSRLALVLPVVGALIGASGALVLACATAVGLSPLVSGGLAIAVLLRVTGAFHEDGLADVADGFGGGSTPAKRLEIMRDSRIGAFGAASLTLALILRVSLIAALISRHGSATAAADLVASASLSRVAGLLPLTLLVPARPDGAGRAAQRTKPQAWILAALASLGIAVVLAGGAVLRPLAAGLAAGLAGLYITVLARRLIGGQTGDVAGAAQQLAEIACLCVYLGQWPSG